jgi:hypothetical protein
MYKQHRFIPIVGASIALALTGLAASATTAASASPKPTRSVTNTTTTGPDSLNALNCPSSTACFALGGPGFTDITGTVYDTFIENWNGKTWTAFIPPTALLSSISCESVSNCFAVGETTTSPEPDLGGPIGFNLIYRWNGKTWSKQATPSVPSYEGQRPGGNSFSSITCLTTGCMAVGSVGYPGSFTPESTPVLTLAEWWNGKTWTVLPTKNPASSRTTEFNSVKCSSASSCMAIGDQGSDADGNPPSTLAEQWNGKIWTTLSTVNP